MSRFAALFLLAACRTSAPVAPSPEQGVSCAAELKDTDRGCILSGTLNGVAVPDRPLKAGERSRLCSQVFVCGAESGMRDMKCHLRLTRSAGGCALKGVAIFTEYTKTDASGGIGDTMHRLECGATEEACGARFVCDCSAPISPESK